MPISRTDLRQALLDDAKDPVALRAMRTLEPIMAKAGSEVFRFDERNVIGDSEISTAVKLALEQEVNQVARISLSEGPFPKPAYMTLGFYRKCLEAYLHEDVAHKLHYKLRDRYNPELKHGSSLFPTEQRFHDLLGENIRTGLKNAMRKDERHEKQWEAAWKEAYRALQTVLVCYIGFAQLNDEDAMTRLEPLVKIVHRALPIGCKKFASDTRIVLTA